jgi:hypothetical protein
MISAIKQNTDYRGLDSYLSRKPVEYILGGNFNVTKQK